MYITECTTNRELRTEVVTLQDQCGREEKNGGNVLGAFILEAASQGGIRDSLGGGWLFFPNFYQ